MFKKILLWIIFSFIFGVAAGFNIAGGIADRALGMERVEKDRITKLYQADEKRIADYQRTIGNITDKLRASQATIEGLENAISGATTASGKASEAVKRAENVLGRMEDIVRGTTEGK